MIRKLLQKYKHLFLFFIYKDVEHALKYSSLTKNSFEKRIQLKYYDKIFSVPLSSSTISAMSKLEKNNEYLLIYKSLECPDIIFDIGTNIGYWIFPIVKEFNEYIQKVHCFEPSSINFEFLNKNLKNIKKISLNNFGLSDEDSDAELGIPTWEKRTHNTGLFSVLSENSNKNEKIKLKKFDDLIIQKNSKNSYLFKIDVEGIEHKVLSGSEKFLSSDNKISIIIELNKKIDIHTDFNIDKSINFLSKNGFKPYKLLGKELISISRDEIIANLENHENYNFIFKNF